MKHKNVSPPMTDTTRPIVVGMMQTPPFTHMFESMRRVYSAKGLCPSCLTHGGGQSRDKGIGGAVNHVRSTQIIHSTFAQAYEERGTTESYSMFRPKVDIGFARNLVDVSPES